MGRSGATDPRRVMLGRPGGGALHRGEQFPRHGAGCRHPFQGAPCAGWRAPCSGRPGAALPGHHSVLEGSGCRNRDERRENRREAIAGETLVSTGKASPSIGERSPSIGDVAMGKLVIPRRPSATTCPTLLPSATASNIPPRAAWTRGRAKAISVRRRPLRVNLHERCMAGFVGGIVRRPRGGGLGHPAPQHETMSSRTGGLRRHSEAARRYPAKISSKKSRIVAQERASASGW
jgi:hypothetical protein